MCAAAASATVAVEQQVVDWGVIETALAKKGATMTDISMGAGGRPSGSIFCSTHVV